MSFKIYFCSGLNFLRGPLEDVELPEEFDLPALLAYSDAGGLLTVSGIFRVLKVRQVDIGGFAALGNGSWYALSGAA